MRTPWIDARNTRITPCSEICRFFFRHTLRRVPCIDARNTRITPWSLENHQPKVRSILVPRASMQGIPLKVRRENMRLSMTLTTLPQAGLKVRRGLGRLCCLRGEQARWLGWRASRPRAVPHQADGYGGLWSHGGSNIYIEAYTIQASYTYAYTYHQ